MSALYGTLLEIIITSLNMKPSQPVYNVLLFICGGDVLDHEEVRALMVLASKMPISIIFAYVGNNPLILERYKSFDSKKQILRNHLGQTDSRSFSQVVEYGKYAEKGQHVLAEKVLKHIPDQFIEYMVQNKFTPTSFNVINP